MTAFFLGGALSSLFGAINKLQLMVHLLLINVQIPANATVFFGIILELVTYNFIDIDDKIRYLLKLVDTVELSPAFNDLGYESVYFVLNVGNIIIGIVLIAALLTTLVVTFCCTSIPWIKRQRDKVSKRLLWNTVLSFGNETILMCSLWVFLNLKYISRQSFTSFGEGLSAEITFVVAILVLILPCICTFLLFKYTDKLA